MTCTLYLNTALEPYFYACKQEDKWLFEYASAAQGMSLENLGPSIHQALQENKIAKLDKIVLVTGPGRFTALRLGIAVAKSIAAVMGAEVIGLNSLAAMSASALLPDQVFLTIVAVKPGYYYQALYGFNGDSLKPLSEALLLKEEALAQLCKKLGSEVILLCNQKLPFESSQKQLLWQIQAKGLAQAEFLELENLKERAVQPLYLFEP